MDTTGWTKHAVASALQKLDTNLGTLGDRFPHDFTFQNVYPPRRPMNGYSEGGNFGWTTGFWTGMLWLAHELTQDARFREVGERQVKSFHDRIRYRRDCDTHDLGFLYSLSCVADWKLTGHELARQAALEAADYLMTRFLDGPGIFQAWGSMLDPLEHGRTIIDSIMNMPLLYWASAVSGDPCYGNAAHRHARQLSTHLVRSDNTTSHTLYFDETGATRSERTMQGVSDHSCWARGQAWAIYGFAINYAYTRDNIFLQTACRLADYFLTHLSADGGVKWDLVFDPGSEQEVDSSASAIAVCGLLELAKWLTESEEKTRYSTAAARTLALLFDNYSSREASNSNALLLHGVTSIPENLGIDEASLWGDYFYLEGLIRLTKRDWAPYW